MKALFEILPPDLDTTHCCLACEFSGKTFSYAVKNEANILVSAGVYAFDDIHPQPDNSIALDVLFHHHPILSQNFKDTRIIFSLCDAALIPSMLFNSSKNREVLNLLHGDDQGGTVVLTDTMPALDMYNIYRVNESIYDLLKKQFQDSDIWHEYSVLLQMAKGRNQLYVVFFENNFTVALFLEGECKLINSFSYQTPTDVAYILLSIREQFSVRDIAVEVCGMIEESSSLYKEIYKYFSTVDVVDFSRQVKMSGDFDQYPPHFFTPIFALQLCEL